MNGRIPLLERRENPRECVCWNADPGIAYFDDQLAACLVARDDRNFAALRRELRRLNRVRDFVGGIHEHFLPPKKNRLTLFKSV
jgi:hypothetical protein